MKENMQAFLLWCIATVFIFIAALLDKKMGIINKSVQPEIIIIYWFLLASTGGFLTAFYIKIRKAKNPKSCACAIKTDFNNHRVIDIKPYLS